MVEHWRKLSTQLADILQTDVIWGKGDEALKEKDEAATFFPVVTVEGAKWGVWVTGAISARDRAWLELLSTEWQSSSARPLSTRQLLTDWIVDVERAGRPLPVPPYLRELKLAEWVPFYVTSDDSLDEQELNDVLRPFFDGEVSVLPVTPKEVFVLPSASLVLEEQETEEWRETLVSWADGLVALFAAEFGQEVCAVVHQPVTSVESLGQAWLHTKQALFLGRAMYPKRRTFATWDMPLERLLGSLSEQASEAFLEELASEDHQWWRDRDMRETLEAFFRANLNVSEAARQRFLHRNSLIYRLDKLKQETGRDVRCFEDAVLIYLALMLSAKRVR